jgi:predicted MPP superfamily phosphohydrolase
MAPDFELVFRALALATLVGFPLYAGRKRGRSYAIFGLVVLGFSLPGALASQARLASWLPAEWRSWVDAGFAYGVAATALHFVHLVEARLRSRPFRALVSIPGQAFVAASFLAGFWQLGLFPVRGGLAAMGATGALHALRWLDLLPFVVGAASVVTSARRVHEWVRVQLAKDGPTQLSRVPVTRQRRRPHPPERSALRVVQITDPHLGPWQSVNRLRATVDRLLDCDPDLVLLTGDFLTMEGRGSRGALAEALAPLLRVPERCFAVFGNHDHEAPEEVRGGLEAGGVRLLVDEEAIAQTRQGPVQLLGADHVWNGKREHLQGLLEHFPRREGVPRLLLLHDPMGFRFLPDGAVDLTLSGHTHGGQIGLVSLGLSWTVLSRSRWPDHGLFALGSNRLYVHRGTGFYGFPLRVGVPGEASVLELVMP